MTPPNDWEIKKCLSIVIAILLASLGLIGLAALGYDIPGLRQIVGFIYLTFVPGLLILRILRIHEIGAVKTLLYSVGLSLAFVMFTGLFMNSIFPYIGISKPLSVFPLVATLTAFIAILCSIAYKRDRYSPASTTVERKGGLFSPSLFLILLPLVAIFGTYLINFHENNILLMTLIVIISVVIALAAFGKFFHPGTYALAIVAIAIGILYSRTMISMYVVGQDIHREFYFQGLVLTNGYWDATIPGTLNAMLSIVMLCPIYSIMLNMDSVWIAKVIYPLFFSLIPLALFEVYREQVDSRKAFLAAFFFMSMIVFFTSIATNLRTGIAELFLALLILLMVDRGRTSVQKAALAIIFIMALTVSHYALAYIGIALFILGWLLLVLAKNRIGRGVWGRLGAGFSISGANTGRANPTPQTATPRPTILNGNLVCLFLVFTLAWYMYTASAAPFNAIVGIGHHVYSSLAEFFSPMAREAIVGTAIGLDWASASTLGKAFRVILYLTQLFIIVGLAKLILKPEGLRFKAEYIALAVVSGLGLLVVMVLPYAFFGVTRFYHITLIILSPFCILGGEVIWKGGRRLFKSVSSRSKGKWVRLSPAQNNPAYIKFLVLAVLIPYFLFNTGFVFEITKTETRGEFPASEVLSHYRLDTYDFNQMEAAGAQWLSTVSDDRFKIYADVYGGIVINSQLYGRAKTFPADIEKVPQNSYIYLRTWNIDRQEVVIGVQHQPGILKHVSLEDKPALLDIIDSGNKIYANGGSQVFVPK